ncbi:hypothetical protein NDU88_000417 [Pleurodeles waltl]|uniref:Uncharacterized protein n=1 Tax=Pleurodeles waltl TaxID=8319 RepID=A0AAV7WIY4_PLEWA|nr:hypothetical protein NDU88_000417 [Pleurodeles waltl]
MVAIKTQHDMHLKDVLDRLEQAALTIALEKCKFEADEVEYLAHTLTHEGIKPKMKLVKSIEKGTWRRNWFRAFKSQPEAPCMFWNQGDYGIKTMTLLRCRDWHYRLLLLQETDAQSKGLPLAWDCGPRSRTTPRWKWNSQKPDPITMANNIQNP